jgi:uncharacterized SAM-binding protein YcdF (DUF218 family)
MFQGNYLGSMFYFKKLVSFFLAPLHLGLVLALLGLVLLWFGTDKRQKQGKWLVTLGFGWIFIFGMGPVAHSLMELLEKPYLPPREKVEISKDLQPKPEFIVVLAAGHRADPGLPQSSNLGYPAMQRLAEGIILHRRFPGSKLVLSGGMLSFGVKECETMRNIAVALGVDQNKILLEGDSRDTKSQAENLRKLIQDRPFIVVTSAQHMPRTMALMKGQNLNPVPAPTAFCISAEEEDPDGWHFPFPSLGYLGTSHRALHEHVGKLWAKIRGQT